VARLLGPFGCSEQEVSLEIVGEERGDCVREHTHHVLPLYVKKKNSKKVKEKRFVKNYSPSFLRPNTKRSPSTPATGRATVGNSGIFDSM
jgi:hypothetical protein